MAPTLDHTYAMVHVVDPRLRLVMVNRSLRDWCRKLGVNDHLVDKTLPDAFPFVKPSVWKQYRQVLRSAQAIITREPTSIKSRHFTTETQKLPIKLNGNIFGVLTVMRDITDNTLAHRALVKSEQRYRAIVETQNELVCRCTVNGVLTFVNESYCRYFDRPKENLLGHSFIPFLPRDDRTKIQQLFASLSPSNPTGVVEHQVILPSGEKRWQQWSNCAICDKDTVTEIQCVGRDVTDRHRLEQQVIEIARKEQESIGRTLHDSIGQQLTAISFHAKALEGTLAAMESDEARTAARIGKLVRDTIVQTRSIVHGLSPVNVPEKGLGRALKQLAADTRSLYEVACACRLRTSSLVMDPAVATHLYFIAREAVTNAIRHANPTRVYLYLSKGKRNGRLTITDNGCGFAEADTSHKGMGLNIMRYRADIIGGTFTVETRSKGVTRVSCVFPLRALTRKKESAL